MALTLRGAAAKVFSNRLNREFLRAETDRLVSLANAVTKLSREDAPQGKARLAKLERENRILGIASYTLIEKETGAITRESIEQAFRKSFLSVLDIDEGVAIPAEYVDDYDAMVARAEGIFERSAAMAHYFANDPNYDVAAAFKYTGLRYTISSDDIIDYVPPTYDIEWY